MKIEILETRLSSDGYFLEQGDSLNIPDEIALRWIKNGWAQDVTGVVPTGKRRVLNALIDVDDLQVGHSVTTVTVEK